MIRGNLMFDRDKIWYLKATPMICGLLLKVASRIPDEIEAERRLTGLD